MIAFEPIALPQKTDYDRYLLSCENRGCEYSFTNLFIWGRQKAALLNGHLALFSQFDRRTLYPFPVGFGDKKPVLDAIIADSAARGIPCRLSGLTEADIRLLESLYPQRFCFHPDRNSFDYVYRIDDLADLPGRAYQKKRNQINRFLQTYSHYALTPITPDNLPQAWEVFDLWYTQRSHSDPTMDFHMEKTAVKKALDNYAALQLEGMLLFLDGKPVAVSIASALSEDTFDVHFEKALEGVVSGYAFINRGFSRYLREKYAAVKWLNREDDLGLEGLRKAKLDYHPHHLVEKAWAHLLEDNYDY